MLRSTILAVCVLTTLCIRGYAVNDDAYIRHEGLSWTFGTAAAERTVALEDGRFRLESFRYKTTGRELIPDGSGSGEFSVLLDGSARVSGGSGGWRLVGSKEKRLKRGVLRLDVTLRRESLEVTKSYFIYPGCSIIREEVTFKNAGDQPLQVVDPGFLEIQARPGDPAQSDFHWMTGGENQLGSWMLKTESLSVSKPREFDSYEPFDPDTAQSPGDGINASILLDDKPVWPAEGWQYVPNATVTAPFDVLLDVAAGDRLVFLVNMNGNIGWDTTAFDPTIAYEDGEIHIASQEFSGEQGRNGWRYQYLEGGEFVDLEYYPDRGQWRKAVDNATGTPFVGPGNQHPDAGQDAARVWTAPKAGRVRVTGSVCNTGNSPGGSTYGFRMGSATYAPWAALYARDTKDGLIFGWDYMGHWKSSYEPGPDGAVTARLVVTGHKQTLAPGESLTTPRAFVGLFSDDLDNAGNELLDWQYQYMWDYTREPWFPAIRMLGYWWNGTAWGQPSIAWTGGKPDVDSAFRKVFRVADLMRYVGADVYHRDWGWWDRAGDWNGPDFRTTINYLRKYGMGQLIYAFLYTVDPESKVAREHPNWVLNGTLDMSKPEVVKFMQGQLDEFVKRWGDFEWRNDSTPTTPRGSDDTPQLGQDHGLREVIRGFLDKHPECAFQAVNGGGNEAGYDYARYASTLSFSDGAVGILRNYYASLLFPPDKTSDIPDAWNPDHYDKSTWRGLLCINFDMTGDTWDLAKLEGIRELIDIYHYLRSQGVVGRWVRVYRPAIAGDDPTMYLQRLSRDRKRGVIIPKHPAPGTVTIRPKGLLPDEIYVVSFHESGESHRRTGASLMAVGIALEKMLPGELIYLNLPLHPGSKADTEPPTPPSDVRKRHGENMGYPGVELTWKSGTDNNWVSYHEVFRNAVAIDKVAKGTFYFDHSAGADLAADYEVRTVDGAANASAKVAAHGSATKPARVIDDASTDITYTGDWQRETGLLLAHQGTISSSARKGDSAEVQFVGRRVLVFAKLGADCGKAAISIEGGPGEVVDTYSADDIWGVCVYRKEFASAVPRTLRITVTGERGPRAKDAFVRLDGTRVEQESSMSSQE